MIPIHQASVGKTFAHSNMESELFQFASQNVRPLINAFGPVETAFARQGNLNSKNINKNGDERRVDIAVQELKRLEIEVAGLQETRWFGKDT